jgi:hypothetical protein
MKRAALTAILMVTPALLIVRAVVRYNEQQAMTDRVFGTEEERRAGEERVIANGQNAKEAGSATGLRETEQGCLDQGFEREKSGPQEYARLMHFLEGCLGSAQPSPGFCDDVPPYRATMGAEEEKRSRAYQEAVCSKEGFTDWQCRASVRVVQLHCHPLK